MSLDEITGDVENAVNKVLHCVVDRLESRPGFLPWVMLEMPAGDVLRIPSELLPEGIQEGDVVAITRGGSSVTLHLDSQEKARRREYARELRARLAARSQDDGGDVDV